MLSITHLLSSVEALVNETLAESLPATRKRVVFVLIGMLLAGSIVLRRIATTQSHIALSSASAASHERRLRRIINQPELAAQPMYGRVVRRVLRRLKPTERVWLIVDESGHSDVVRVLLAALWYRGRAIPLAWVMWPAQASRETSYWDDCHDLLTQVATLLPDGQQVTVLADRAFGCPAFTDQVVAHSWEYVVRAQGQTRLCQADGSTCALRELLPAAGTRWYGNGQAFKKQGWRTVSVVAYWRESCREPLLLVTSLRAGWGVVRQYRMRSAIEALFRDWKSSGWQWEASQVRALEHQAVLVVMLALATLVTLCLGEQAAEELVEQGTQTGARRPWHARDSLFRLGRDELWKRLWRNDTSEVVWELRRFEAVTWSTECWQSARDSDEPVYVTERVQRREHRRLAV